MDIGNEVVTSVIGSTQHVGPAGHGGTLKASAGAQFDGTNFVTTLEPDKNANSAALAKLDAGNKDIAAVVKDSKGMQRSANATQHTTQMASRVMSRRALALQHANALAGRNVQAGLERRGTYPTLRQTVNRMQQYQALKNQLQDIAPKPAVISPSALSPEVRQQMAKLEIQKGNFVGAQLLDPTVKIDEQLKPKVRVGYDAASWNKWKQVGLMGVFYEPSPTKPS